MRSPGFGVRGGSGPRAQGSGFMGWDPGFKV